MVIEFENLVFEGGGVKGIAYVGALQVLQKRGVLANIKRVGGASAGAITALGLGLGYSIDEIKKLQEDTNFKQFQDDSWGIVRDVTRLFKHYGLNKGKAFLDWVKKLVAEVTGEENCTFEEFEILREKAQKDDLAFFVTRNKFGSAKKAEEQMARLKNAKPMYFVVTNLDSKQSEVLSHESWDKSDTTIADAVRASMSIPLFFAVHRIKHTRLNKTCTYVDGGALDNYPIRLFDFTRYTNPARSSDPITPANLRVNSKTLGFRVDTKDSIKMLSEGHKLPEGSIDSFRDYLMALITTILDGQNHSHMMSGDAGRTIYIDSLDVNTTDFSITKEKQAALIQEGIKSTSEYLNKISAPSSSIIPINFRLRLMMAQGRLDHIVSELEAKFPDIKNKLRNRTDDALGVDSQTGKFILRSNL